MFDASKIALAVAFVVGAAWPALASDHGERSYGGPVQTWCDINPACNGWDKRMHHAANEGGAAVVVASPNQKHRPTHHDALDH
jgi:hypothetical protein